MDGGHKTEIRGVVQYFAMQRGGWRADDRAAAVAAEGIVKIPDEVVPVVPRHRHKRAAHQDELNLRITSDTHELFERTRDSECSFDPTGRHGRCCPSG